MKSTTYSNRRLIVLLSMVMLTLQNAWADSVVWSCSRSEPKQTVFEGIRAFRLEKISVKDHDTISITLMDLYAAYGGEVIQHSTRKIFACRLQPPAERPIPTCRYGITGIHSQRLDPSVKTS